MYRQLPESSENVLGFLISDRITLADVHQMYGIMADAIAAHGSIRLLMEVEGFRHMEPEALAEKFKFAIDHARDIEKMAVVSDRTWIKSWVKVTGLLAQGRTEHFHRSEIRSAWEWLRE